MLAVTRIQDRISAVEEMITGKKSRLIREALLQVLVVGLSRCRVEELLVGPDDGRGHLGEPVSRGYRCALRV